MNNEQKLLEALKIATKALDFYACGENEIVLTGFSKGKPIDWDAERKRLDEAGFVLSKEAYNGWEFYVEDGATANYAMEKIRTTLEGTEYESQY